MSASRVVIVHGVQTGDNASAVEGPRQMHQALSNYVAGRADFTVSYPAYENLNDDAQEKLRLISKLVLNRLNSPVAQIADKLIEVAGDVYTYNNTSTGKEIRALVRSVIENNNNCILVGHSLGSVVCFDIVSDLMREGLFIDKHRNEWPIKSLITFGSPLALNMFKHTRNLVVHQGKDVFNWYNYSDRNDPVISGSIFGQSFEENHLMSETYKDPLKEFHIHDRQIETGFHLLAHISYWRNPHIISRIADQFE